MMTDNELLEIIAKNIYWINATGTQTSTRQIELLEKIAGKGAASKSSLPSSSKSLEPGSLLISITEYVKQIASNGVNLINQLAANRYANASTLGFGHTAKRLYGGAQRIKDPASYFRRAANKAKERRDILKKHGYHRPARKFHNMAKKYRVKARESKAKIANSSTVGFGLRMAAGTVVGAAGMLAAGIGIAIPAVSSLTNAFLDRAKELKRFSPDIATASAMNNVNNIMADLKEAQTLGPDMGRMMTASNDIWLEIRNILLPMKKLMVEMLAGVLEKALDFMKIVGPYITASYELAKGGIKAIVEAVQLHISEAKQAMEEGFRNAIAALNQPPEPKIDFWKQLEENMKRDMLPVPGAMQKPAGGLGLRVVGAAL